MTNELPVLRTIGERVMVGLSKISLALKSRAWKDVGPRGLTPTQAQILTLLKTRAGMAPRLTELAEQLAITPATTSDAVSALARKGLIRKHRSSEDARALAVTLTEEGRAEAEQVSDWPAVLLGAVDALTDEEREIFLRSVVKMIRALQDGGQIPVMRMCVSCRFFRPNAHADPTRPHHCAYVDAPFGDRSLRVDCREFEEADSAASERAWASFLAGRTGVHGDGPPGNRRARAPEVRSAGAAR